ncbi:unnamed protein product [Linum trigynum]|uniref:DUF4283 domain-containing protein n=1 Tax=Linum trigynum TaxID=586398 RepID=A0AAV2GCF5_9ROSI
MLSTDFIALPTPAPLLPPTDRPPEVDMSEASLPQQDGSARTQETSANREPVTQSAANLEASISSEGKDLTAQPSAQLVTSYKAALAGETSAPTQPIVPWTFVGESDLVLSSFNGEPELIVSDTLKSRLCAPWKKTLVVRLLGQKVSFSYLCSQLRWMWRPVGKLDIMDLDEDAFLTTFDNDQDYLKALTGGPWIILDHYLIVYQWSPSFRISDAIPRKVTA